MHNRLDDISQTMHHCTDDWRPSEINAFDVQEEEKMCNEYHIVCVKSESEIYPSIK